MANPTNQEQLLLELINYTRLDPMGGASMYITSYAPLVSGDADIQMALDYFGVSGSALQSAFQALTPTHPLAWSGLLADAARGHSQQMINFDQQSHQLPGEADLGQRATSAGYSYSLVGENIYAYSDSMLHAHAGFMVDWGPGTDGMQSPPGHRNNIMNTTFREVGLGVLEEANAGTAVGPYVVTEDFGARLGGGPQVFLLGVSYADGDSNHFYSIGEGRGGMSVSTAEASGLTTSSGGYTLELTAGAKTITFSGGGLATPLVVTSDLANGSNAKIDVQGASTLLSSVSLTTVSGVTHVVALGVGNLNLTGAAGNQVLDGNSGGNTLSGLANDDTLNGLGGNDILSGGDGNDVLGGGTGNDTLNGGSGIDTATYAGATAGVTVSLALTAAQNTGGAGSDTLSAVERLTGGSFNDILTGAAGANVLKGGGGRDVLNGLGGRDTLTGNGGNDVFVLGHPTASDTITDFTSGADDIRVRMSAMAIGDGDTVVEGGVVRAVPGGFAATAELVIFTANIGGAITAASAAAAIGSAGSAYAIGNKRLFAVDNGTSSALFLFTATDANAVVSAAELTQLASLANTPTTVLGDYVFGT